MTKTKLWLLAALALSGWTADVQAETITEDFETVALDRKDAYGYGAALTNGWNIVGGKIYSSAGSAEYGIWNKGNSGTHSLEASYSATNKAFVVIPVAVAGTMEFYSRKTSTSSSTKGYVDVFEVEQSGDTYTRGEAIKSLTLTTTSWTKYEIDLGDAPRLVGFCLSRAAVDDVTYSTYEAAAGPQLQVLADGKTVKDGASYDFGLVEGAATVDYVVRNTGTDVLTATIACEGGYSVSPASVTLEAGGEQTVTITQSAEAGSKSGSMTISPEGLEALTVSLKGIVRDAAKYYVDFAEVPADWTIDTSNWTIDGGYAAIGYCSTYSGDGRMVTPLLEVAPDEALYVRYRKNTTSAYSQAYFCVWTSTDGTSWTQVGDKWGTDADYDVWQNVTIGGGASGSCYVAISGQYVCIDDFYGFALSTKPVMTIAGPGKWEDGAVTDDFGFLKADATHSYTVSNTGKGVLVVDVATSDAERFAVSADHLEVAAGESAALDIVFVCTTDYGKHTADIVLTPQNEGVAPVTISVSAIAQDPETFEEDFEAGIPATWTNDGWEIATAPSYGNGTKMAYAGRYSTTATLTTPSLVAQEGDAIELEALLPWNDETLTMEYSLDGGETWTVGFAVTPADNNTLMRIEFAAPQSGTYLLRFSGRYNYIDNVRGFKIATGSVTGMGRMSTEASARRYDLAGRRMSQAARRGIGIERGKKRL